MQHHIHCYEETQLHPARPSPSAWPKKEKGAESCSPGLLLHFIPNLATLSHRASPCNQEKELGLLCSGEHENHQASNIHLCPQSFNNLGMSDTCFYTIRHLQCEATSLTWSRLPGLILALRRCAFKSYSGTRQNLIYHIYLR